MFTCSDRRRRLDGAHPPIIDSFSAAVLCVSVAILPAWPAAAQLPAQELSVTEQNRMMERYCVLCHMDRSFNGGLSLERFDAATVSPGLAAMLASKFTTGVPGETIIQAVSDAGIAEEIEQGKAMGAPSVMGIAGLPLPSVAEINGFILAMAARSSGADEWHVVRSSGVIDADIVRVTPSHVLRTPSFALEGERDFSYRLALSCDTASGEGSMTLSWSPVPANGVLLATVDDGVPLEYVLDEQERMANGDPGSSPPSSVVLAGSAHEDRHPVLSLPEESLRIGGPIPGERIQFPFSGLTRSDRDSLKACFD